MIFPQQAAVRFPVRRTAILISLACQGKPPTRETSGLGEWEGYVSLTAESHQQNLFEFQGAHQLLHLVFVFGEVILPGAGQFCRSSVYHAYHLCRSHGFCQIVRGFSDAGGGRMRNQYRHNEIHSGSSVTFQYEKGAYEKNRSIFFSLAPLVQRFFQNRLTDPAATVTRHPFHPAYGFMLTTVETGPMTFIAFAGTIFFIAFTGHMVTSSIDR